MFGDDLQRKACEATRLLAEIAAGLGDRIGGTPAVALLQELAAGARQLELAQCLAAEQVDRSGVWQTSGSGASSTVAYLKKELHESGAWVSRRVRLGRALQDALPQTRRTWADGRIGMDKATEIMRGLEGLDAESTGKAEAILAEAAPAVTMRDLRELIDSIRALADPEVAGRRDLADFARQAFNLSQTTGGYRLSGWLNTEAGTVVKIALEQFLGPPPTPTDAAPALTPRRHPQPALPPTRRGRTTVPGSHQPRQTHMSRTSRGGSRFSSASGYATRRPHARSR